MALESLSIKFDMLTPQIMGGKVTVKITVTDAAGKPYPVLAQDFKTKFDGKAVVTAPHGLLNLGPVSSPPPSELQQQFPCPPAMINTVIYFIDPEKLDTFLKTHKDAVWYYTTEPLSQSRRYFLDVEVNDGIAGGTGTWSLFPSSSRARFPSEEGTAWEEETGFRQVSFPLLAQAEGWECQTIGETTICGYGTVLGAIGRSGEVTTFRARACGYFLISPSAPEGVTQFRWTGSGPPDPGANWRTTFEVVTDGRASYFPDSFPELVAYPGYLLTGWFAPAESALDEARNAIFEQVVAARFVGWTFQVCLAGEASLTMTLTPDTVRPSFVLFPHFNGTTFAGQEELPNEATKVSVKLQGVGANETNVIVLTAEGVASTGGHTHPPPGGDKPAGELFFTVEDVVSDKNSQGSSYRKTLTGPGSFSLLYRPTPAAGTEKLTATLEGRTTRATGNLTVLIPGLENFETVANPENAWIFEQSSTTVAARHTGKQYLEHFALEDFKKGVNGFFAETGAQVSLNDMSLARGGVFDFDADWGAPKRDDQSHKFHRQGYSVDFNQTLSDANLGRLAKYLKKRHWHQYIEDDNIHFEYVARHVEEVPPVIGELRPQKMEKLAMKQSAKEVRRKP